MADTLGPAPETLQSIHQSELQHVRRQFMWSALFLCLFGAVAAVFGSTRWTGSAFILGIGLFATIVAALEWRKLARVDPLSSDYAAGAAARADAAADRDAHHAERLATHPARITMGLIIAIVAIAALQVVTGGVLPSVAAAGLVKPATRSGQWWRLLTATYLHGSLAHLIGNMAALAGAGRFIEAYVPRTRVLLVYLSAALAGSMASLVLLPNTQSIGASGGIVGLFGYLFILARRRPTEVPPQLQTGVVSTIGLAACIGVFGFGFIDNAGHAGGALAGMAIGMLTIPREGKALEAWRRGDPDQLATRQSLLDWLGWAAGVILLAGAVFTAERLVASESGRRARAAAELAAEGMTPIRSVVARVIGSTPSSTTVVFQNLRDVPLEAWRIDVYAKAGETRPIGSVIVDACCSHALSQAAPIAPHSSETVTLPRQIRSSGFVASVRLVVFADLAFEGSKRDRDLLFKQREQAAGKLASLERELEQGPDRSAAAVRRRIAEIELQRTALLRHAGK